MEKFYWAPTREDRIGVCMGIFTEDNLTRGDVERIVDAFPGQSIDFFGALRARVYDDKVRRPCFAPPPSPGVPTPRHTCISAYGPATTLGVITRNIVCCRVLTPALSQQRLSPRPDPPPLPPCFLSRQVREFVASIGHENLNKRLVNSKEGKVSFEKPNMSLDILMQYGQALVGEQDNVKRVQLADAYLGGAELAGSTGSSVPEQYEGEALTPPPPPGPACWEGHS
jgi:hypothetical protein